MSHPKHLRLRHVDGHTAADYQAQGHVKPLELKDHDMFIICPNEGTTTVLGHSFLNTERCFPRSTKMRKWKDDYEFREQMIQYNCDLNIMLSWERERT